MTSIIENLIRRQAAHVKESGSKIAAAEHLEAAAKLLRLEASAPAKLNFKAEARNKEGRLAKFAAAMKGDLEKETRAKLSAKGWSFYKEENGVNFFSNHSKKGCRMLISNGSFSVDHGNLIIHPKTSIKLIDAYLDKK